jgi:glycosyltransferase involved in cell wall biosynthesis
VKILHVVHGYWPATGGSQGVIQNLSERMVKNYGDDVTVFTTTAYSNIAFWRRDQPMLPAGIEEIDGVTVRRFAVFNRFGRLRFYLAGAVRRLRLPGYDWLLAIYNGPIVRGMTQAVACSKADVVSATAFPLLHMNYAVWGAKRGRIPSVLIPAIHTLDAWGYDRPMIYHTARQADRIIAYTPYERDYLSERGIAKDRVRVIGIGVDAARYANADGRAMRLRFGWVDRPLVIVLARHEPHKRIDIVIAAMRLVWPQLPQAQLLIAGERTAHSHALDRQIEELPAEQRARVTSLEHVTQEEKAALLAASDVLVLASRNESFGHVFIEAWACGKPVVGVRTGAIASVVDEGIDGLLAPYEDPASLAQALCALLNDPARRAGMGESGRRKVLANYTWDVVTPRFRSVYQEAIEARRENNPA